VGDRWVTCGAGNRVAAYFGLMPRVSQSGDKCYHGSITKQGRSSARWLAVEAVQSLSYRILRSMKIEWISFGCHGKKRA